VIALNAFVKEARRLVKMFAKVDAGVVWICFGRFAETIYRSEEMITQLVSILLSLIPLSLIKQCDMKRTYQYILFLSVIFFGCKKGDTGPQGPAGPPGNYTPASFPIACFTVDDSLSIDSTQVFTFTNCSQNAVRYEWDFDDFTYAPVANPVHVFNKKGNFTVSLTAYNTDNESSQTSHVITIGNYSLSTIEYYEFYSNLSMPLYVSLYNSNFYITDTIINQNQIPFTHQLSDSSIYDFFPPVTSYNLRTQDLSGHNYNRVFPVSITSIINGQFDTSLYISSSISIIPNSFTLHYKIIYN
jgi:hypothetical protein